LPQISRRELVNGNKNCEKKKKEKKWLAAF
jgi:hypothetical protein